MRSISPEEAASKYGITTRHDEMDNGETRFRLEKRDGVAYIRTEASARGGWQESHFHATATETYIVQRGWIVHASLIGGIPQFSLISPGESVISPPGMVHNIYIPSNAVMHTLKHGDASTGDAIRNEESIRLDEKTQQLSEVQLLELVTHAKGSMCIRSENSEFYPQDYRHFDTLIWQVPTWSSAIFALTAVASGVVLSNLPNIAKIFGVEASTVLTYLLGTVALVLLLLWNVLLRFRMRQAGIPVHPDTFIPARSFFQPGGQECLQFIVAVEVAVLLAALLLLLAFPPTGAALVAVGVLLALVLFSAYEVRSAEEQAGRALTLGAADAYRRR